jgi:Mg2+ and Co2+ transporter CorA
MHDPSILTSDWVCYAMMYVTLPTNPKYKQQCSHQSSDDIIDSFEPFTRAAEAESEAIEDQVFIARIDDAKELIPQVDFLRKRITHIIRCLHGKVDVLNGFVKRCQSPDKHPVFPDGDLLLYLGDVQDHLVTTLSSLGHIDEIIGRSQANCLAQLSATNLRLSLTINSGLSKVTLLATIFVPCHLVTGMWGMNVEVPGKEDSGLGWFFGILGCFAAFMVVCVAMAARYKLL